MNNIFVVNIESVESRYTYYWFDHVPAMLRRHTRASEVVSISGDLKQVDATKGAFLNFNFTNEYKSIQVKKIARMISDGTISDGDVILFCDAWHPGIINTKYMIDLAGIDVKMVGIWHAGSYDDNDFLGRMVKDKSWSMYAEKAMSSALDVNVFATMYHLELFIDKLGITDPDHIAKLYLYGLPFEYIPGLAHKSLDAKENLVCFPHRIAPEKNIDLFLEIMSHLPEYGYIICQESKLSKDEYYNVLARSKVVFSANLQETLGIGVFEGMVFGACPVVPNDLSYREMYPDKYKYDRNMSPKDIAQFIRGVSEKSHPYNVVCDSFYVFNKFFSSYELYEKISSMLGK